MSTKKPQKVNARSSQSKPKGKTVTKAQNSKAKKPAPAKKPAAKKPAAAKTAKKQVTVKKAAPAKKPAPAKKAAPAKKPVVKKAPAKKPAPAKKAPAKKPVVKKAPAKKPAPAKKAPAKKPVVKKAPAKKPVPAKKAPAKKPVPAKKAPAKKPVEKKAPAKKPAPAKKAAPAKKPVVKAPVKKSAPAKKAVPAKNAPEKKPVVKAPVKKSAPAKKPELKKVKKPQPTEEQRQEAERNLAKIKQTGGKKASAKAGEEIVITGNSLASNLARQLVEMCMEDESGLKFVTLTQFTTIVPEDVGMDDVEELQNKVVDILKKVGIEFKDEEELDDALDIGIAEGASDDPVKTYLRQMGRTKLLTKQQEQDMAKTIRDAERQIKEIVGGFGNLPTRVLELCNSLLGASERFDHIVSEEERKTAYDDRHCRHDHRARIRPPHRNGSGFRKVKAGLYIGLIITVTQIVRAKLAKQEQPLGKQQEQKHPNQIPRLQDPFQFVWFFVFHSRLTQRLNTAPSAT